MKTLSLVALFLISCAAFAQEGWCDEQGHITPEIGANNSVNGFGGLVLVTSDADWKAKWETPSSEVPHFNGAGKVHRGDRVFVLTFFANPQLNSADEADVTCDITVTRPTGVVSTHQTDAKCFGGELKTDPHHWYLAAPVIGFVGEPDDPVGVWLIQVTLKDNFRHVAVPLETSIVLLDK